MSAYVAYYNMIIIISAYLSFFFFFHIFNCNILLFIDYLGVCIVESCQPDIEGHYHASYPFGILGVLIAIITSGFAGVYFESILKSSKSSM
jgi:hypothetical protein